MYSGFDLKGTWPGDDADYQLGQRLHAKHKLEVKKVLDGFLKDDGSVDASKMQENWFPQIQCDAFISHSHADERVALAFSGWLKSELKIDAFVDSCAWGYADELLQIIDDKYCVNDGGGTYSYQRRNKSTSHVHMMLSVALSMMIDRTEALFFLNTPSSIKPQDAIKSSSTRSPWLYAELAMTKIIRRRRKRLHRRMIENGMQKTLAKAEPMDFNYNVTLDHLTPLSVRDLNAWREDVERAMPKYEHPLDGLYKLKGIAD